MALWYTFFSINSHTLDGKKASAGKNATFGFVPYSRGIIPRLYFNDWLYGIVRHKDDDSPESQ